MCKTKSDSIVCTQGKDNLTWKKKRYRMFASSKKYKLLWKIKIE